MITLPTQAPRPSIYYRLPEAVILVTLRGREVFDDSRALFLRLEQLAEELPADPFLLSIYTAGGQHFVSESGVAALETMLRTVGLNPFLRVCRQRSGPERASFTRWQWDYLGEFLGWEWHRAP